MSKEEFLIALPLNRKVSLYMEYLEYNKYYDDLEAFYEMDIKNAFNKKEFEYALYDIMELIDRYSRLLTEDEWKVYENLEEE